MKTLTLFLATLFAASTLSAFIPINNLKLKDLEGTWYVQSIYDTTGSDWSNAYCFQLTFNLLNESTITLTSKGLNGLGKNLTESATFYTNATYPSTLYGNPDREGTPLLVVNSSSIPYWVGDGAATKIFAFNYTREDSEPYYIIMAASKWYDTSYDLRPYLRNQFPVVDMKNFWFINTACDTHYDWKPLQNFNASTLLQTWNLLAVYDPASTDYVPWYTEDTVYDWKYAFDAKISFQTGEAHDHLMTLSTKSLYGGDFTRTWQVLPAPEMNSALLGFNLNGNTLLYVSYADDEGNLILTTGSTTSFFLSKNATSFSSELHGKFATALYELGYAKINYDLIQEIDGSS